MAYERAKPIYFVVKGVFRVNRDICIWVQRDEGLNGREKGGNVGCTVR